MGERARRILRIGSQPLILLCSQVISQFLAMLTSILLIRLLDQQSFAVNTFSNSVLIVAAILADMGLLTFLATAGAKSQYGPLKDLIATIRILKRYLCCFIGLLISYPLYCYFGSQKFTPAEAAVGTLSIVVFVYFQQFVSTTSVLLNLKHLAGKNLLVNVTHSILRSLLTVAAAYVTSSAICVLVAYASSVFFTAWVSATIFSKVFQEKGCYDGKVSRQAVQFAVPLGPSIIYHALKGQVFVFALALLGTDHSVAEFGAVTRFGMVFSLLSTITGAPLQGWIAGAGRSDRLKLLPWLLPIGAGAVSAALAGMIAFWRDDLLLLLGSGYVNLGTELALYALGSAIYFTASVITSVLLAQGASRGQNSYVALSLILNFIYFATVGVETTFEAVTLGLADAVLFLAVQLTLLFRFCASRNRTTDYYS